MTLISVTAGNRQKRSRSEDTRPRHLPRRDGDGKRWIESTGITHRRKAFVERNPDVLCDLQHVADVAFRRRVFALLRQSEMRVRVRQAGHQRHAATGDFECAIGRNRPGVADTRDAPVLNQHACVRLGVCARAIEQGRIVEQDLRHRCLLRRQDDGAAGNTILLSPIPMRNSASTSVLYSTRSENSSTPAASLT